VLLWCRRSVLTTFVTLRRSFARQIRRTWTRARARLAGVTDFFHFVPGYQNYVFRAGREPLFFLLLAFLLTFLAVRTYTRLGRARAWRSGSVRGIHLHHSVPGIIASLAAGTAIIAFQPGDEAMLFLSALFGAGAA
jgi:hypothetical protein